MARRRSSTSSFGGHLLNAGIMGDSDLGNSDKLLYQNTALKDARRRRMSTIKLDQAQSVAGNPDEIPMEAYSSNCPVHGVASGCTGKMKRQQLPAQCRDSPICQGLFGNTVDLLVRSREGEDEGGGGGALAAGVDVGVAKLSTAGWTIVEDPQSMKALKDEAEKEHFFMALRTHGLKIVNRPGEIAERMMLIFKKDEIPGKKQEVKNLVTTLAKLDHVNIVKFLQACEDEENVYFIYEDCDGAGLLPFKISTKQEMLEPRDAAKIIQQLAASSDYCTQQGLYHWDWSLWHVMSSSYQNLNPVKLFGVGLAGVMHSGKRSEVTEVARMMRGGFYFVSPELAQLQLAQVENVYKKLEISQKEATEVWGIGCLAYWTITNHPPFGGVDEAAVLPKICSAAPSFDAEFAHIEAEGIAFFESLLAKLPKDRPQLETIVTNSWIMHKSRKGIGVGGVGDNRGIVDRLRYYVDLPPVVKALGHLFVQSLRSEKLSEIEEAFRMLDVKGDGDLDFKELSSIVTEKRDDIRMIFKALDQNGSQSLSASEFTLANVFAEEVLTERMLRATFISLDEDGQGSVSPEEIFKKLREINPDIHVDDVVQFMGDADTSFDLDLDFEEFLAFFPQVQNRNVLLDKRIQRGEERQQVSQETFKSFNQEVEDWVGKIELERKKLIQAKQAQSDEAAHAGSSKACDKVAKSVKACNHLVKTIPVVHMHISTDNEKILLQGVKHKKKNSEQYLESGTLALAEFLHYWKKKWIEEFVFQRDRSEHSLLAESSKAKRAVEIVGIIDDCVTKLHFISKWTRHHLLEQASLLEAAEVDEGKVPKLPLGSRGAGSYQDDENEDVVAVEIREYQKRRAKEVEELAKAQAEQDSSQAHSHSRFSKVSRSSSMLKPQGSLMRSSFVSQGKKRSSI